MKAPFLFRKGQTNIGMLYQFVLLIILVGMIIGVGIITMDAFSSTTYYTRSNYNDTVLIANYTAQQLDWGNITVTKVWNGTTNTLNSVCYTINATPGYFIYTNQTKDTCGTDANTNFQIIYSYLDYKTATSAATANVSTEIANIASDWIGLIVTVFILAIILGLVIMSFRPGMER